MVTRCDLSGPLRYRLTVYVGLVPHFIGELVSRELLLQAHIILYIAKA